jgi:uncharacterized membrane protein YhhN
MLVPLLAAASLLSAALTIRAEYAGARRQVYRFKPLPAGFLAALVLFAPDAPSAFYRGALLAGLLCSLAGDVLLMLPSDRFVAGLGSFLLAHLCYVAAFVSEAGVPSPDASLAPFLLCYLLLLRLLWPHLGALRLPVAVYGGVLLFMAWTACWLWREAATDEALAAFTGALLFVVSDASLAWNRFVRPFAAAQALVLGTYFTAQLLLALSV